MNPYSDGKASLIKFVRDTLSGASEPAGRPALEIVDFDAMTDEDQMPDTDIMGIEDYSITDEDRTFVISARVVVSTKSDKNLFRLRAFTNTLFNACAANKMVPLFDAESGTRLGVLKFMTGTFAMPIVTTQIRSYQFVAVSLGYAGQP